MWTIESIFTGSIGVEKKQRENVTTEHINGWVLRKPGPIHLATRPGYPSGRVRIIGRMSETYQSKRERWQRMQEALPADLRPHVSLRNVEAVNALTPQAQTRLLDAIQAGLKRLPRAIEQLKANPDTPVSDLLNPAQAATTPTQAGPQIEVFQEIRNELADLVQACYPDMPRLSAEALVEAEAMQVAGEVAQALSTAFRYNVPSFASNLAKV